MHIVIPHKPVLVLGSTGFVGTHVVASLTHYGAPADTMRAPRLHGSTSREDLVRELAYTFESFDVVVNAAGIANPTGRANDMHLANAVLPGVLAEAAGLAEKRFIHVSSAAVQGRREPLDSTPEIAPTTPYSISKALGEAAALAQPGACTIYRPPGVHSPQRAVTKTLVRYARSRFAAVASPGLANTPQALATNVGDAIALLALIRRQPPSIVHHPSEGLTTGRLLELLGGKSPSSLPKPVTAAISKGPQHIFSSRSRVNGLARRLEVLLLGQAQAPSWLASVGWSPRDGHEAWAQLGTAVVQTGRSS